MSWWRALLGLGNAGGGSVARGLVDLASEAIADPDKRAALVVELANKEIDAALNPAWLRALAYWPTLTWSARFAIVLLIVFDGAHKLARAALWAWVIWAYIEMTRAAGAPLDWSTMAALAGGPYLYTAIKGRGR